MSFPTKGYPRLEFAAEQDVGRSEISPFGLHWPILDEDLSFAGILAGRYGERRPLEPPSLIATLATIAPMLLRSRCSFLHSLGPLLAP